MNPIWPGRRRPGVPLKVMPDAHSSINNQALPLEKCEDREVSQVAQRSALRKTADRPVEATDECQTARGDRAKRKQPRAVPRPCEPNADAAYFLGRRPRRRTG